MSRHRSRRIHCTTHGRRAWSGQVICLGCGAVWHLNRHNPPTADKACTCGQPLVGPGGTARAICAHCYTLKRAQQGAAS